LLNNLGEKLGTDGAFGPSTKGAWQRQASARGQNPAFDRSSPTAAWVSQQTFSALSEAAYAKAPKPPPAPTAPAAAKPATPTTAITVPTAGKVDKPVLELQQLLYGVGWTKKKLAQDGAYGPQTKRAWGVSAKLRKLPEGFERVDGKTARVALSTYEKIKADGQKVPAAPAPAPVAPAAPAVVVTPAGKVDKSVAELQGLLYGVGWTTKKLPSDGKYGPATKSAWAGSAKLRGLPESFDRVDGRTARVDATTYEALKAKMPATKAPKPAAPKPATVPGTMQPPPTPAGKVDKLVAELQGILYGVGWTTKKLPGDGKYGPATKSAWAGSAKLRGLPQSFERIDGLNARVDATTYEALKAKMPATKAPKQQPAVALKSTYKAGEEFKVETETSPSAGYRWELDPTDVVKLVRKEDIHPPNPEGRIGVPYTTVLTFAAQKSGTFRLRNQPPGRQEATEFRDIAIQVTGTPKTGQDKPVQKVTTKPVLEVQKLLQAIGWRARTVPTNGKYDANLKTSWEKSARTRKLDPFLTKIDARTVKLSEPTFYTIQNEVQNKKPVDLPKPPEPSKLSAQAQALIKLSTESFSAETVQQALAAVAILLKIEPLPITGVWGQAYTDRLISDLYTPAPNLVGAWKEALLVLVSPDGRTVKIPPSIGAKIPGAAAAWVARQQQQPPVPSPEPAPTPPGPLPPYIPEPGPLPAPTPGPSPEPGPGPGPGPEPGPEPAPPAPDTGSAAEVWSKAVSALQSLTQKAPAIDQALQQASAQGLHPEVQAIFVRYIRSADKLSDTVAGVIAGSQELRAALDASGPSVGFAGFRGYGGELGAYFGELEAVADRAIELLRAPLAQAAGLKGLGQAGPALSWAARLGAPAWARLMELLRLPVVTTAAGVAIAGKTITDSIHGETEAYLTHEEALAQLVAEGALTTEQYNAFKQKIPEQKSIIGPVVLGVVALGGLALYFKNRRS
jgi:predicted secreted protein